MRASGVMPDVRCDGIARLLMARVVVTLTVQTGGRFVIPDAESPTERLFEFGIMSESR